MLPRRIRPLSGRARPPRRRNGAIRVSSRAPDGRSGPSRHRHPAVAGKACLAGFPPRTPRGERVRERAFGHRYRRALALLRSHRGHRGLDRRTARAAPRCLVRRARSSACGARRRDRRGTSSGNDLAVVEQGHRHRPPLRPRRRGAYRARRRVVDRAHRRRPVRDLENARRIGPAPRPHDAVRISSGRLSPGRIRLGRRHGGDLPRRNAPLPLDDRARRRRARSPGGRERIPRPRVEFRGARLPPHPVRRARPRPDRHRADDVRAGELRTLPPQDLQRIVDHRRRRA